MIYVRLATMRGTCMPVMYDRKLIPLYLYNHVVGFCPQTYYESARSLTSTSKMCIHTRHYNNTINLIAFINQVLIVCNHRGHVLDTAMMS